MDDRGWMLTHDEMMDGYWMIMDDQDMKDDDGWMMDGNVIGRCDGNLLGSAGHQAVAAAHVEHHLRRNIRHVQNIPQLSVCMCAWMRHERMCVCACVCACVHVPCMRVCARVCVRASIVCSRSQVVIVMMV